MTKQTGSFFKNAPLVCPNCGDEYLRYQGVEVYCRDKEGGDLGSMTRVSGGGTSITRGMEGNPSKRGDGVVITFACETCDYKSKMVIAQEGGQAFFSME
ncbi:MAG: hypothetical protein HY912_16070 [Desulfomonile tiedjei]|uniref:Uncharacterized protein n=1 Tax=Desulfomonile tiedjei TaxID=2358 RepID=A0A9D6V6R5_9BACT|nr:hypothetical protein [Desulfomonile tiedjei]